jgi:tetratricopeptide (TPR) repeat protein
MLILVMLGLAAMLACSLAYMTGSPLPVKKQAPEQSVASARSAEAGGEAASLRSIVDLMRRIQADPESYALRMEAAEGFIALSDWENALGNLKKALDINPDDPAVYQYISFCLLKLERREEAARFRGLAEKMLEGKQGSAD